MAIRVLNTFPLFPALYQIASLRRILSGKIELFGPCLRTWTTTLESFLSNIGPGLEPWQCPTLKKITTKRKENKEKRVISFILFQLIPNQRLLKYVWKNWSFNQRKLLKTVRKNNKAVSFYFCLTKGFLMKRVFLWFNFVSKDKKPTTKKCWNIITHPEVAFDHSDL